MRTPQAADADVLVNGPWEETRSRRDALPAVRLPCSWCYADFDVPEFLGQCRFYWRDVQVVRWDCPDCGKWEDLALEPDEVRRGYVYSTRIPNFAHMGGAAVPGLRPRRGPAGLVVEYGGRLWHVPDLGSARLPCMTEPAPRGTGCRLCHR